MVQSLQGGSGQEKGVGASRLTSQTCLIYAGVNAVMWHAPPREQPGPSTSTGVDVGLGLKDD
ncbi:hypothetical protein [Serratia sp. M24T3]|uniref:hypothetical protein n=1 Tax=Serratia sp. M24T3 TaxID=932213 RepID=UPI00025BB688|nr:hypothetical protein [Serratia sp. M24T3]EIC83101.1 Sea20 [Serratia sp. M24T3]